MIELRNHFPRSGTIRIPQGVASTSEIERRKHSRKGCTSIVDYSIKERVYKDFILNISAGGALICTGRPFFVGEEVSLAFLDPVSQEHRRITGEIVWVASQGVGVKFKSIAPEDKEPDLYDSKTDQEKSIRVKEEVRKMGKVKKKRVRWQPSANRDVTSYRLYWSKLGEVSYDSDYAEFGNVTEVVLPDDVSAFPLYSGDITLGVSSVNAAGNESDITKITAHFNFEVPDAPKDLEVEDM